MAKKRAFVADNNPLGDMFTRTTPRNTKPKTVAAPTAVVKTTAETKTVQTTIIITADQLEWLDYISFDSKKGNGRVISKSELFRELIDFLRTNDLKLRNLKTSDDIQERLGNLR